MPTKTSQVACALAALALFLSFGCSRGEESGAARAGVAGADPASAPLDAVESPPIPVPAVVVVPGLDTGALLTTFLEPRVDAPVPARHDGIVREVRVREGQAVARGAVLARLDDDDQRLVYESAQAHADQARAERDRKRKLAERQIISEHELEVAEAAARMAEADARLAKLDLERCTLRAPVAGIVRLARAEPHAVVAENEILFRIADASRLRGSLYLPQTLRGRFEAGGTVRVMRVPGEASRAVEGTVRIANSVPDPVTGLFRAEIELEPLPGFEPGTEVRVLLDGDEGERLAGELAGAVLPRDAYLERAEERLFVWRLAGSRADRVRVELGELGPDGFQVLSGLAPGDLVLASGASPPPEGARITAQLAGEGVR